MLRKEFIKKYSDFMKENYPCSSSYYDFDIYVDNYDDGKIFPKKILAQFLKSIDIEEKKIQIIIDNIDKNNFKIEFDSYYEEDEDNDLCRFNCRANIHRIYDIYVENSTFDLKTKKIYRLEHTKDVGLYSGFFATLSVQDNHPSPQLDPELAILFHDDNRSKYYDYHREWYFGFDKLEDLKSWIGSEELLDKLKEKGYVIKNLSVPENFVIVGDRQLVFQKKHVAYEDTILYEDLYVTKNTSKISL